MLAINPGPLTLMMTHHNLAAQAEPPAVRVQLPDYDLG